MGLLLNNPLPVSGLYLPAPLLNMRGCITGATGWFGSWIRAALDYNMMSYEMLDTRDIHRVDCDWLIHLAPGDCTDLIAMLQKTDVKHVLFVSSGSVYDVEPTEYGIEKRTNEDLFLNSGLPVNIARCFTFTGGGVCQKPLAIGNFIKSCLNKKPVKVLHDGFGYAIRTYMYMTDLVQWLMTILLADKGNVYDVGGDAPIDMLDLADYITYKFDSYNIEVIESKPDTRPNYIPNLAPAKELGLNVTVGLDEAIEKTIEWEIINAARRLPI